MPIMTISLTDDLKEFVDQQVEQGSFATASEYVCAVLRREQTVALLRDSVLTGASGPRLPMNDAYFAHLRADALRQSAHS